MENFGKTAVFPGGYGRIGEIPYGRIWPDWGLKGLGGLSQIIIGKKGPLCPPFPHMLYSA